MILRSLRSRLALTILAPLIAVGVLVASARYLLAARLSQELYDDALLVAALAIARDVVLTDGDMLADQLRARLSEALGERIYYRVEGPDGAFVTGYTGAPQPVAAAVDPDEPVFYDGLFFGAPVRAVALRDRLSGPAASPVTVQVWQTVERREALSLELLAQSMAVLALAAATAVAAVWLGVARGLRPLNHLGAALRSRSPDDLGPLTVPAPTEARPLLLAINGLLERLRTAFAERDGLISDAAHQLRNPVAAIRAQADSVATAPTDPQMRARARGLTETAAQLSRLTQQLLSMEKARGAQTRVQRVDLTALARDSAAAYAPRALRADIDLSFEGDGPVIVQGDAVMLREAVDNLLDNALTHGARPGGAVLIRVEAAAPFARLTVQDDGPGVPEPDRERVFQRFQRGAEAGLEGCGLGLPIVRAFVERQGGTVRLTDACAGAAPESAAGPGARFTITLPLAPAQ